MCLISTLPRKSSSRSVLVSLLLAENLLNLTDFPLNFSGDLFNGPFDLQFWIIGQFSGNLFGLAFNFVKCPFCLISHP